MYKNSLSLVLASVVVGATALSAAPVHAHISMDGPVKDRGGNQKTQPCGGAERSSTPFTFEPGATITLGVAEAIPHDGYFRISFDDDGDDSFKDPVSIDPINPNRYGPGKKCETTGDNCGKSDFCSVTSSDGGPTVLWDNLDPHLGASSGVGKKWSWTLKLPDVECDNCTIQVMQVMEDPAGGAHGPFDGDSDLYYRCVDVVLKKGAGKTPGTVDTVPKNKGIDCLASGASGSTGSDAGAAPGQSGADAGGTSAPKPSVDAGVSSSRDAGAPKPPVDEDEDEDAASEEDRATTAPTGKVDAGKPAASKDAGKASSTDDDTSEDDDEEAPAPKAADDGCSVGGSSGSSGAALGMLLSLGMLATRRRKHQG